MEKLKHKNNLVLRCTKDTSKNEISNRFIASKSDILSLNETIEEGEFIYIEKTFSYCHIVSPCETLDELCLKYSISKQVLIFINNLKTEKLFIGQQIFIP